MGIIYISLNVAVENGTKNSVEETKYGSTTCSSSVLEVEAQGSGVQGHPSLHSKVEASVGYMRV